MLLGAIHQHGCRAKKKKSENGTEIASEKYHNKHVAAHFCGPAPEKENLYKQRSSMKTLRRHCTSVMSARAKACRLAASGKPSTCRIVHSYRHSVLLLETSIYFNSYSI